MGDLLESLEVHMETQAELATKLKYHDFFQKICELNTYEVQISDNEGIPKILDLVLALISSPSSAPYLTEMRS